MTAQSTLLSGSSEDLIIYIASPYSKRADKQAADLSRLPKLLIVGG
jgi:hypothetical protein